MSRRAKILLAVALSIAAWFALTFVVPAIIYLVVPTTYTLSTSRQVYLALNERGATLLERQVQDRAEIEAELARGGIIRVGDGPTVKPLNVWRSDAGVPAGRHVLKARILKG